MRTEMQEAADTNMYRGGENNSAAGPMPVDLPNVSTKSADPTGGRDSAVNAVGSTIDGLPWIGSAEPDYVLCLLVFAFSVIVYTAFGGFRAVVWTDVMQGIVMGIGVIILCLLYTSPSPRDRG